MGITSLIKKELRECLIPLLIIGLIWLCLIGAWFHFIEIYNLGDYSRLIQQRELESNCWGEQSKFSQYDFDAIS